MKTKKQPNMRANEQKDNSKKIIIALAAIFFLLYIWLPYSTPLKFNSPDETANYFWAKQVAAGKGLAIFEPLNLEANDLLHPRSIIVRNGFLLPGSFLGLPLVYGAIGQILGIGVLPYLSAALAALGALAFYKIISKIWGKQIGLVSFFLYFVHPAIFYYTAREFFHNVPFVSLLILSAYFFIIRPFSRNYFLGASMLGLALFLRVSEAVWILPLTLILLFLRPRGQRRAGLFSLFIILGFFAALLFYVNNSLYGNPLRFGYTAGLQQNVNETESADAEVSALAVGASQAFSSLIKGTGRFFLPFGFDASNIIYSVRNYFLIIIWWISIPAIFGFLRVFWKWLTGHVGGGQVRYLLLTGAVSVYLFIYYGSFILQDNPTLGRVTMTSSYLRYWLPLFILLLPFAASCYLWLANQFKTLYFQKIILIAQLIFVAFLSFHLIFYGQDDGLIFVKQNVQYFTAVRDRVIGLTENDAVIAVDRGDKIFFPERRVIYPLRDEKTYKALPILLARAPLYYYGIGINHQEFDLLNRQLGDLGLKMDRVEIFGKEALYKFTRTQEH